MNLEKQKVKRDGKRYTDLFVVWEYQNHVYKVRIRPCFAKDFELLLSASEPLPEVVR